MLSYLYAMVEIEIVQVALHAHSASHTVSVRGLRFGAIFLSCAISLLGRFPGLFDCLSGLPTLVSPGLNSPLVHNKSLPAFAVIQAPGTNVTSWLLVALAGPEGRSLSMGLSAQDLHLDGELATSAMSLKEGRFRLF